MAHRTGLAGTAFTPRWRRWWWKLRRALLMAAAVLAALFLLWVARLNLTRDRGFDVVLITLDTLRADHVSCYAPSAPPTPNLDRLAARGARFRQAVAAIPRTTQNVCTIFTGRYPQEHGVRELADALPEREETLAETLARHGFATAAFVGGGPLGEDQGIYQGFGKRSVFAYKRQARALPTVARALAWLLGHAHRRYFLWVHLYDPHFFYAPPWPFYDPGDPRNEPVSELYEALHDGRRGFGALHFRNDLPEETRAYLRELYAGEVRYTDFAVGWLLRAVRAVECLDPGRRTLVIVTADHGESLGEHDYFYLHGNYLYEPDVRVPLIVALPGAVPEGAVVDAQVRSVDILPTVRDLLGLEPDPRVSGRSLLPLIRGEEEADRPAFIESDSNVWPENPRSFLPGIAGKWRAVRDGGHKLIRIPHPNGDLLELYDLAADPAETTNLADRRPDVRDRLLDALRAWEASAPRATPEAPAPMDDETREKLRSLGYID